MSEVKNDGPIEGVDNADAAESMIQAAIAEVDSHTSSTVEEIWAVLRQLQIDIDVARVSQGQIRQDYMRRLTAEHEARMARVDTDAEMIAARMKDGEKLRKAHDRYQEAVNSLHEYKATGRNRLLVVLFKTSAMKKARAAYFKVKAEFEDRWGKI